jgi:hypothetical protein
MRTRLMTATITAITVAGVISLNAQAPPTTTAAPQAQPQAQKPVSDTQRPTTDPQAPAAQASGQMLTITGCLKEEKDVPGLNPNVAERAGITEDYILTNVKMAASSTVSGIALAPRYELEGIDKSELKKHVNHQVEISGTITQAAPQGDDKTADFRGTSIKMLSATCAAN